MTNAACQNTTTRGEMLIVDVQYALGEQDLCETDRPPGAEQLSHWARTALQTVTNYDCAQEITIRVVGVNEITQLNLLYRDKNKATNVLSFPVNIDLEIPAQLNHESEPTLLGDIVICHQVVVQEARQQGKVGEHHYAHMVTHGLLHLCGFDHGDDESADEMESLEIRILAKNNIANPY